MTNKKNNLRSTFFDINRICDNRIFLSFFFVLIYIPLFFLLYISIVLLCQIYYWRLTYPLLLFIVKNFNINELSHLDTNILILSVCICEFILLLAILIMKCPYRFFFLLCSFCLFQLNNYI
jgi:hypothetical protein